jgi:hypothetical protein
MLLIADEQHFKIRVTANRHYLVGAPTRGSRDKDSRWTSIPGTPSDYRSISNSRAQLRRIGVRFGEQNQKGRRAA